MSIGAKLIIFFLVFYALFGLYFFIEKGTPNGTNDFIFHYSKAQGNYFAGANEYYDLDFFNDYPPLTHYLSGLFAFNKYAFYLFFVLIIMGLIPLLLDKIAGRNAIIVYFLGVSLPHMALYSGVFASIMILVFFLIYLLNRRNILVYLVLALLSALTHKEGLILFGVIGAIEIFCYFYKHDRKNPLVVLTGSSLISIEKLLEVFLFHTNFLLIWLARKNFDLFYMLLFIASFVGSKFDMRIINVAQIVLCIVLARNEFDKKTWILLILLGCYNTFAFCYQTASFLY